MSKLRDILAIIIFCSFFFNCSSTTEGEGSEEEYHGIGAYAGPDQICKIGHVVVLDGSKSNAPEGEVISGYSWTQSGKNPEEVDLLKRQEIQYTTFKQVGEYKFYLRIEAGDQYSAIDSVIVTVQPSGSDIFIDPHMEATVRFALNHYTKKLTNEHLLSLDSILAPWFVEITNLGGLERCGNLEYLLLDRHSIEDLTPIKNLTKLLFLRVDQNFAITDVSPLAGLTNLEYLDISDNLVTDISPLFRLTNLTYFGAQFNQGISDISVVSNFQNIEKLYLSKSPIHNISPVANLTKLQKLWLAKCDISDITPVQNLVQLRLLYLKWNNISDISPIRNLVNVERLYLRDNKISDISACENLPHLALIELSKNLISDIYPLVKNQELGLHDLLNLKENPLSDKSIKEYIPILMGRGVEVEYDKNVAPMSFGGRPK